jgi:hypothetical protein
VRALVVTQNITVDGSIEMLGDWFDPEGQGDQSDLLEELHRQDSQSDAFLTRRLRAECGQVTGRLADVPFHGMEPETAIGDMSDAQTLAGRQQVLHSLREQRAQGI